jgi:DNA-binding GntR family transcriptional regulator
MSVAAVDQRGVSKADAAYAVIRARIVDGSFAPGARLVLDQLARELNVSPVPIREAIRRLEAEGYVEFRRNLGAAVATVDVDAYVQSMQTLAVLEAAATALAAPQLQGPEISCARKLNDDLAASLERLDPVSFTDGNHQLHKLLYGSCPNLHMIEMIEREWSRLGAVRRSTFAFVPMRAKQSVAEHEMLIAMIEAREAPESIEQYAREHRMRTVRTLLERPTAGDREQQAQSK